MRILHLTNTLVDRGNGIINVAVDLAIEQKIAGHEVAFVAGGGNYEELLRHHQIDTFHLEESGRPKNIWTSLQCHRRALHRFRPNVVHAHMRSGLLAIVPFAKLKRIPVVGHVHNVQEWQSRLFALADAVIAVSQSVSQSMQEIGIRADKLHIVLNGPLGSKRFENMPHQDVGLNHPAIVTVAGMNERKGIRDLIDAFDIVGQQFTEATLYLVGDGPSRQDFEAKAALSPMSQRIIFAGFRLDPRPYMKEADIFVLASRRESLGLVLLEAREEGCAIVATSVDGIPEALDQGRAGFLVPPQQPQALANALGMLLRDKARREKLSIEARLGVDKFTTTQMAANVMSVYETVIRGSAQ